MKHSILEKNRLLYVFEHLFPLLIWALIVFGFSSQPYDQQDLRPFIKKHINEEMVERIFDDIKIKYAGKEISINNNGVIGFIEFIVRKGAHVTEYLILGFLTYRTLYFLKITKVKVLLISILLDILYAGSDEFHQSFTVNRTPHLSDVMLDSVGAVFGIVLAMFFYYKWKSRESIF